MEKTLVTHPTPCGELVEGLDEAQAVRVAEYHRRGCAKCRTMDLIRFDRSGCLWYCGWGEMDLHFATWRLREGGIIDRIDQGRVFADHSRGIVWCTEKCQRRKVPAMTVKEIERGPSATAAAPAKGHAPPPPWPFLTEWDLLPDAR